MKKVKSTVFYVLASIVILFCISFVASLAWVGYYSAFDVGKTIQMQKYRFKNSSSDSLRVEYQWVPVDSISRNVIVAVLAAQDENFYVHNGFSPIHHDDSVSFIPKDDETITQLAVHSVFLTEGDNKIKSFAERYLTILTEYMWGKDRILEIYLNTAPLGHGIFGVEAASQIYFGKSSALLTREEAAFIAILFANPQDKQVDFTYPPEEFCSMQYTILMKMGMLTQVKIGRKPIDETIVMPTKPIYKRKWRG
ncbi:transglycosylase domain-containing protein [Dysgonomonas sp. 520]|uniref:transglycosylase domain-containing protein n=1 Tax=Dysgonomonas sp. 520 TaxID=2302931 RepID=UPI0013D54A8A|nr:transglycosylase domain-containing protein [Dysgonomonas sp. 520]NDW08996.1 hypothetical protein [Dysgonomonas sp. 520]